MKPLDYILDGILAILVMFMFTLLYFGLKQDSMTETLVQTDTSDFVQNVRSRGYLTKDMYDDFLDQLSKTGLMYDVEMEHRQLIQEPKYRMRTADEIINERDLAFAGTNTYHYLDVKTDIPAISDPVNAGNLNTETNESILAKAVNKPADPNHLHTDACYASAVRNNDSLVVAATTAGLYYSYDNITWTPCNTTLKPKYIAYGNGMFMAATREGAIMSSHDGVNWTWSSYASSNYGLCFINGRFILSYYDSYSGDHYRLISTVDNINWKNELAQSNHNINYLAYSNGYYCEDITGSDGLNGFSFGTDLDTSQSVYYKHTDWDGYFRSNIAYGLKGCNNGFSFTSDGGELWMTNTSNPTSIYNWYKSLSGVNVGGFYGYKYIAASPNAIYSSSTGLQNSWSQIASISLVLFEPEYGSNDDYSLLYYCGNYLLTSASSGSGNHLYYGNLSSGWTGTSIGNNTTGIYGLATNCVANATLNCSNIVTSISPTNPFQTVYSGDNIISTVLATYLDGSTKTIVATISGYDKNKIGTQTVTLTFTGLVDNAMTTGSKTCTISVTVIPRTKTCANRHTYNLNADGSDPGCPYCKAWLRSLNVTNPATGSLTIYRGTTLKQNGVTLKATYMNGHTELVTDAYIDNLDKTYVGTQNVTLTYKGQYTHLTVTNKRNIVKCPVCGRYYELFPDDTDPGCPYCAARTPIFTGDVMEYYDKKYTDDILKELYHGSGIYYFSRYDNFNIKLQNSSRSLGGKLTAAFYQSLTDGNIRTESGGYIRQNGQ